MINFLEKIISESNSFDQNQSDRISVLEKTVSELIFVISEQQKIIQSLVVFQNDLNTHILSTFENTEFLPEDLN